MVGPYRAVLGVIGNDIHVVALRLLDIALTEVGVETMNIGVNRYLDEFVEAVVTHDAHAVLLSSNNGEAELWCANMRRELARRGKGDIVLYIGGTLQIGLGSDLEIERKFLGMGFDRVYSRRGMPGEVARQLVKDLARKDAGETA